MGLILFLFKASTRSLCLNVSVSGANQGMPTEPGPHRKVEPFPLKEGARVGQHCTQSGDRHLSLYWSETASSTPPPPSCRCHHGV